MHVRQNGAPTKKLGFLIKHDFSFRQKLRKIEDKMTKK